MCSVSAICSWLSTLPPAVAVVDPKRPDSKSPFCEFAGVGVALNLVCAMQTLFENKDLKDTYRDIKISSLVTCISTFPDPSMFTSKPEKKEYLRYYLSNLHAEFNDFVVKYKETEAKRNEYSSEHCVSPPSYSQPLARFSGGCSRLSTVVPK